MSDKCLTFTALVKQSGHLSTVQITVINYDHHCAYAFWIRHVPKVAEIDWVHFHHKLSTLLLQTHYMNYTCSTAICLPSLLHVRSKNRNKIPTESPLSSFRKQDGLINPHPVIKTLTPVTLASHHLILIKSVRLNPAPPSFTNMSPLEMRADNHPSLETALRGRTDCHYCMLIWCMKYCSFQFLGKNYLCSCKVDLYIFKDWQGPEWP